MSKLVDAHRCIMDAQHIVDLIEMSANGKEMPQGGTISEAVRIAGEKLTQARRLIDEAEAEAKAAERQAA